MSFLKLVFPGKTLLIAVGAATLIVTGTASAQTPSQKPLLSRDGGGVKPNLVVTLDTSASMDFQHAPEYEFKVETGSSSKVLVTFPNFSFFWMHPLDPGPGYYDGSFKGIIPANPYRGTTRDSMLFQMQMRSPDLNTIYYNPEFRYDPWIKSDGTRMAPSAPTAAPFIPMMPDLKKSGSVVVGTANLTGVSPVTVAANTPVYALASGTATTATLFANKVNWCGKFTAPNTPTCTTTAESYYPMIYYRLNKDASGYFKDPSNFKNYSFVDINGMKSGYSKKDSAENSWAKTATDSTTGTVTLTSFPKFAARTDCGTVTDTVCTQAQERQNYANWFTYYRSRMLLAQGAIPEAFKDIGDTLRLGWGRIHKGSTSVDGASTSIVEGGVRDFNAATRGNFINWLRNHPGNTDPNTAINYTTQGGTPLIAAVEGVGEYFRRTDNGGPWSDDPGSASTEPHKTCRRAYNMLVTDGYYSTAASGYGNYDGDNRARTTITGPAQSYTYVPVAPYKDSNLNTLADVAMKYWAEDLRGASGTALDNKVVTTADDPAFWQHMTNYMIGLGVNGNLDQADGLPSTWPAPTNAGKIDDLWHAAENSRGKYYNVKDPKGLTDGIKAALGLTLQRELRESGVATASTTLQDGNRKYVPRYRTGAWSGDVQSYALDANGQTGVQKWTAESKVPAWGSRNIYTWNTDTSPASATLFTWDTMGATNQADLGTVATTPVSTSTDLVEFLRGDRSKEGDGLPFRERKGVLGDFINSNPVLVKDSVNMSYGTLATGGASYASYLTAKAARTAVLFVGGNDGMLHAFKDTIDSVPADDGKEIFAYVPKAVYSNLSKLSDKTYGTTALYHQFYVDGPLMETDAFINAPGESNASWRNYLLGSLGSGGRAVFALDVTSTASMGASTVRWELSNATNGDLGYVSAAVQVGVLPNGEWVAIFGNGVYSDAGKATLFVVNLQTGIAQTLNVETSGSNGLGGVGVIRNGSGQITTLYAGDLKGNMWKFNYLASAASRFEIAGGSAFFTATHTDAAAQSITQAPVLFDHSLGGKIVVFGTGRLVTETDANSTATQATYGVWDKTGDAVARPMGRSNMVSRSLTSVAGAGGATFYSLTGTPVDWTSATQRGWLIDLDVVPGMRVVYPPQVISKKLALVSVVKPASSVVACDSATGSGANLLIPVEEGLNPAYPLFDTDEIVGINSSDAIVAGYATNADGIDAVVTGTRTCLSGVCKTKISIQNTTGQMGAILQDPDESIGTRTVKDRVWRRIINPPIR